MTKKSGLSVFFLVLLLGLASSCDRSRDISLETPGDQYLVEIEFALNNKSTTKSSVSVEDNKINNLKVFSYRGGELDKCTYTSGENPSAKLKLVRDIPYNIYAVANMGDIDVPRYEKEIVNWQYGIKSMSDLNNGLPMCWSKDCQIFNASTSVEITLQRLVSKLTFSVDPGLLSGLEITSVKLFNCASKVSPFIDSSKVNDASSTIDGDYASSSDITSINNGDSITLYALENCQGVLLPENTAPKYKVPDNLLNPELCTYLEVECQFNELAPMDGFVTYRLYPGLDNTTNFDLIRNTNYALQLCLTTDGLDEVSWRVEVDGGYKPSLGSWQIAKGMHQPDDLYIGETSLIAVTLDESLGHYLTGRLSDCRISYGNGIQTDPSLSFDNYQISDGKLYCEMTCNSASNSPSLDLYLYGPSGKMITNLINAASDRIEVKKPYFQNRDFDYVAPEINGDPVEVPIYLVDSEGRNLNSSDAYRFSLEPFNDVNLTVSRSNAYQYTSSNLANQIQQSNKHKRNNGEVMDDGPAYTFNVSIENDGTSSLINWEWSHLYKMDNKTMNKLWSYRISSSKAISLNIPATFSIIPIKAYFYGADTFVDGLDIPYASGTNDTYLAFSNPSNITVVGELFLTATHAKSMSALNYPVKFLSIDSTVPKELVGADAAMMEDSGNTSNYYTSMIDDTPVRCYPIVKNSGRIYCSAAVLGEKVKSTVGSVWNLSQMDIVFKSLGGKELDIKVENRHNYWKWNFNGVVSWTADDTYKGAQLKENNHLGYVYLASDLERVFGPENLVFDVRLDEYANVIFAMRGNTLGHKYNVSYEVTYETQCSWKYLHGDDYTTATYHEVIPKKTVMTSDEEEDIIVLQSAEEVVEKFSYMNLNYWHESCDNMINVAGNRYAALSMPVSIRVDVVVSANDSAWVPVRLSFTGGTDTRLGNRTRFYSRTRNGCYPENNVRNNPDGSSRGADKSATYIAGASDYYTASSASYKLEGEYSEDNFHTFYRY